MTEHVYTISMWLWKWKKKSDENKTELNKLQAFKISLYLSIVY